MSDAWPDSKQGESDGSAVADWLERAVAAAAFPRASAAWGDANGVRAAYDIGPGGTGVRAANLNPASATVYDLASLSKVLATTMVALRLIDRGEVSLHSRLDESVAVPPDKAGIRLVDLLTHTAGFASHFRIDLEAGAPEWSARAEERRAFALREILGRPLEYATGSRVVYSCLGYITLQEFLEQRMGLPLDRLAQDLVFGPLGMDNAGFRPLDPADGQPVPLERIAPTETDPRTGSPVHGEVHDENARFIGGVSGNAGVFATLPDVARFATMLSNAGAGFLSPSLFARAVADQTQALDAGRGLGLAIYRQDTNSIVGDAMGPGTFGHTGFTGTSMYVSPTRGIFAVLLTNRVHLGRDLDAVPEYRAEFHEAVVQDATA